MKTNEQVAAVGVGYSTTGRRTGLSSWQLAIQAATAAMADAGMTAADIDGVTLLWGVAGPAPAGLDVVEPDEASPRCSASARSTSTARPARPTSGPPSRRWPPSGPAWPTPY